MYVAIDCEKAIKDMGLVGGLVDVWSKIGFKDCLKKSKKEFETISLWAPTGFVFTQN